MSAADRTFALWTALLTAAVPTGLAALQPFGEARSTLGIAAGWGAALAVMVPSYLLLGRTLARPGSQAFLKGVFSGTLLRLAVTIGAVLGFALLVEEAPVKGFVLSYFAGYLLLTTLELRLTVGRPAREVSA